MQLIVSRSKTHEFRKVLYPTTVRHIWFYETSPISSIRYICQIGPPVIRPSPPHSTISPTTAYLPEDGSIGNAEYNAYAADFEGYNYAYPILSCIRLSTSIGLARMKEEFGIKIAPRRMIYVPEKMKADVSLEEEEKIW